MAIEKKLLKRLKALYVEDDSLRKKKYIISNMSNVKNIYTSTLSPKVIIENSDKKPILHILNNKEALPIIATGHLTTVGVTSSESVRDIYIGTLEAFPANAFPKADYIALGHIHRCLPLMVRRLWLLLAIAQ